MENSRNKGIGARIGLVGCNTDYPPTVSPAVHIFQVWHRMQAAGFEVHTWGPQAVPGRIEYPRTEEGFRELLNNVDLLYARFPFEYFFTTSCLIRLLSRRSMPVICEFNAPLYQFTRDVPWRSRWGLQHRARIYGRNHAVVRPCVDYAICTCEELAGYARNHFGIRQVSVLPDGADHEQFHPGLRAEGREAVDARPEDFLVFWGGITKYRWQALDRIIDAARGFHDGDVRFVIAGDAENLPKPLPDNVIAVGHQPYDSMPKLMAAADACLCVYESYDWCPIGFWGSPLKLFEYMACGRPVIASDMGQIARVIRDGKNGFLTDGTPEDIVRRIRMLRDDADLAQRMGEAARETVLNGYTWQSVADRTAEIVDNLLQNRPKRRRSRGARREGRRLGFISAHGGYGGTEEYLNKLVRAAASNGDEVTFFHPAESPVHWVNGLSGVAEPVCYDPTAGPDGYGQTVADTSDNELTPRPERRGVVDTLRDLHRRLTPKSVRYLMGFARDVLRTRKAFSGRNVDVLHFSDLGADPPILAARLAGVRRITGALNCLPRDGGLRDTAAYRLVEALCLHCVDDIAAVSGKGKDLWSRRAHLGPDRVRVVYNSTEIPSLVEVAETSAAVRRELGIPLEARVVGVSAALVPIKGHACLLRAFAGVVERVPDAMLVLAGDGPQRARLESLTGELDLGEHVLFLGHRTDIRRVVQAYDVVSLASVTESLPFSLLEGMSYGKPAVATAVGGVPELVLDGVNGYVVPPRDAEAMRDALVRILTDEEAMARMGVEARRSVERTFSAERMIRDTMAMVLEES